MTNSLLRPSPTVGRLFEAGGGDIIAIGTPPGVGMGTQLELTELRSGDIVTLGIERLGGQRQLIVGTAQ